MPDSNGAIQSKFSEVPVQALRSPTRNALSLTLNPIRVLPNDDNCPKDWRGLAYIAGMDGVAMQHLKAHSDPTSQILQTWSQCTFEILQSALGRLDRWDVVDDTTALFESDATAYLEIEKRGIQTSSKLDTDADSDIITVDDIVRMKNGLGPQVYDAFLLYADEDYKFAKEVLEQMEKHGLKLCDKDRDFIGGLTVEFEAIRRLIATRCNRLVVIITPKFLESELLKFCLNFAQSLGIEQRCRKVVPCLFERCNIPLDLRYYFLLDYTRQRPMVNFWEKLRISIDAPQIANRSNDVQNKVPVVEHDTSEKETLEAVNKLITRIEEGVLRPNTPSNLKSDHGGSEKELNSTSKLSLKLEPQDNKETEILKQLDSLKVRTSSLENVSRCKKFLKWIPTSFHIKKKRIPL